MVAISSPIQAGISNRRRRVRHKIQTPAYATFNAESQGVMLDLHEIVNISEDGVAIQCHSPLEVTQNVGLCLDLAGCPEHIFTSGQVVWVNSSGRAGLRFLSFPPDALSRLREWLFVNVISGVANTEADLSSPEHQIPPAPNYSDTLAAITSVQRQVEVLGRDFGASLQFIAERTQVMVRASGAAIALSSAEPNFMICRASSGLDAPPVGARLQVGSGFSGECVQKGILLRCDDTEVDPRVDRESCRALGIRSLLAAPLRSGNKSIGLIETFSPQPFAFMEADERVLLKLAETVLDSLARAARAEKLPSPKASSGGSFSAPQGSVLFASADADDKNQPESLEEGPSSITLPRSYLFLLTLVAAFISLVLGIFTAPLIQSTVVPWAKHKIFARRSAQLPTVLASSKAPTVPDPSLETASFDQLRQMAQEGDPAAENALGLRYFKGDPSAGLKQNELEAAHWFIAAAENGNVAAQSKLGFLYWSGRGVPKDINRAYLWTVVACENPATPNDPAVILSRNLAQVLRQQMTREQWKSIESQARIQAKKITRQQAASKPDAGQPKS